MKTLKDYTFKELVDEQAGQTPLLWRFELEQDKEKE
jgi:hypothetical protein